MTNFTNQKFGMLTAIKFDKIVNKNKSYWFFECDCGKVKSICIDNVRRKKHPTISCGCQKKESMRKIATKHGMSNTRLYRIWKNIKTRCQNPKQNNYERYGGRGIRVCNKWQLFIGFQKDMATSYEEHVKCFGSKQTSIDRIDNNKGYSKENCRWTTPKENCNNRRKRRLSTKD